MKRTKCNSEFLCYAGRHITPRQPPPYLEGPLISMCPHVNAEGGIVGKFFEANLTAEAGSVFGFAQCSLEMGKYVLLQGTIGGESAAARPHWTFERCLACVG